MEKLVLIAAGGTGTRMQSSIPKQFLLLYDKPILYYTIRQFLAAFADIQIVLCVPEQYKAMAAELMHHYFSTVPYRIVAGGHTRFHTVQNGIASITSEQAVVFVQDAARCLVSVDLIRKSYYQTLEKGNAIPVILPTDSMRTMEGEQSIVINRNQIRLMQTPQTFFLHDLKAAFLQTYQEIFTDEATVIENLGKPLFFIEGEIQNIKITTPFDLEIASLVLGKTFISGTG
jgi:2-C-methyl-D-erythritol 4-phosphate cytidylyltransferase